MKTIAPFVLTSNFLCDKLSPSLRVLRFPDSIIPPMLHNDLQLDDFMRKTSGQSLGKYKLSNVQTKFQLDATEVFIADLTACSTCFGHQYAHHQELKSIIQWLLPVVFRAVVFKLLVWCGAEGYVSGLLVKPASCKPDTYPSAPHQTNNLKTTARNTTGSNHCIIQLRS